MDDYESVRPLAARHALPAGESGHGRLSSRSSSPVGGRPGHPALSPPERTWTHPTLGGAASSFSAIPPRRTVVTRGSRPRRHTVALATLLAILTLWRPDPAQAQESLSLLVERPGVGPFIDDDGSPFEDDIVALWAAGIATGCETWAFCPDRPITRGEMAAVLRRARPESFPNAEARFSDVGGSVFAADIGAIAAAGVTAGCAPDLFCPDDPVTRATMAAFLRRTFQDLLTPDQSVEFEDLGDSVFADDVAWLAGTGVTSGCRPDAFCPGDPVTRGQMAAFLRRALRLPSTTPPGVVLWICRSQPARVPRAGARWWSTSSRPPTSIGRWR